jgi:hypothetical protein
MGLLLVCGNHEVCNVLWGWQELFVIVSEKRRKGFLVRVFFLQYHFGVDFVNRITDFIFLPANDISERFIWS